MFPGGQRLCPIPHRSGVSSLLPDVSGGEPGGRARHRTRTTRTKDQVGKRRGDSMRSSTSCWSSLTDDERAMMHSQHGPLTSSVLTAVPTNRMTRFEVQLFLFSADASACPCPHAPADVAACSTHLAIIVQRALRQGSWLEGAYLLNALRHKCAGKPMPG